MSTQVIEDVQYIQIVRLFTAEQCRALLRHARLSTNWSPAYIYRNGPTVDPQYRSSMILWSSKDPKPFIKARQLLAESLEPLIRDVGGKQLHLSTLQLIHYRTGGFYKEHRDAVQGLQLQTYRRISLVCSLNGDFVGGATAFPTIDVRFRPKVGEAVVFPSFYLHCGEPVTKGEKFILNFFLEERVVPMANSTNPSLGH